MPAPAEFLQYVDNNADLFIKRLAEAVAIPSVSGDVSHYEDVVRMAQFLDKEFKAVGAETKIVDLGTYVSDGQTQHIPPTVLGRIGNDPNKTTILVYGHFDVQPANLSDGWDSDPFTLVVRDDGRLVGRGSTDDKGPVLGWLNVLQYHFEAKKELPVNFKFCFEGMEESGSLGLDDLVKKESQPGGWFDGVDAVCISDSYWLNTRTPMLTYGLRGLVYYKATVTGPAWDLHSGAFGRTVFEPMTDLIILLSKLVDVKGNILVPTVDDMVGPADDEERALYESLDYSIADIEAAIGSKTALSDDKVEVLMGRMREPSLSIHGIEGAFSGVGSKTVIPAKVSGKFSLRLVPPQTPESIDRIVKPYLESEFAKLGSKNTFSIENIGSGNAWVTDPNHWNFEAAKYATVAVYGKEPDLTREGGSIPVTLTFADALGVNVLLLPMGRGDDGEHSTNEKLDRANYIGGTKLLGTYLYEVSTIDKGKK